MAIHDVGWTSSTDADGIQNHPYQGNAGQELSNETEYDGCGNGRRRFWQLSRR